MTLTQVKFLLDENVPRQLKKVFNARSLACQTVQEAGWGGLKNGELIKQIHQIKALFVTRDTEFTFLWRIHALRVIYFAVEPATLPFLKPRLERVLDKWYYD